MLPAEAGSEAALCTEEVELPLRQHSPLLTSAQDRTMGRTLSNFKTPWKSNLSSGRGEEQPLAGKALGLQRLKSVPHDHDGNFGPTEQEPLLLHPHRHT